MRDFLEYLREFHLLSVVLRLLLAALAGFSVGYGRSLKERNAGLRTYTLVSIGAALTVLISMYEYQMLCTHWAWLENDVNIKFDGTRFAAQVISGIGFLAAGTILSVSHQQISGLTSAIGLFAAAGMGIAAGAGFYECVIFSAVFIIIAMEGMQSLEVTYKRRLYIITMFVEFDSIEDIGMISDTIHGLGAEIFDLEIENSEKTDSQNLSAILIVKLAKEQGSHSAMLSSVAELPCVFGVRELIS
ncbi:MAG: MgtC/SapB family protein [Oscillospiraceae bacterium]|nr:MgtC/SapB family protein [Oscillospiraceae bacterium]